MFSTAINGELSHAVPPKAIFFVSVGIESSATTFSLVFRVAGA